MTALRDSHRVWAVRADLHQRAGHAEAAIADYDVAIGLADNQAERRYLEESRSRAARACAEYIPPKNTGKKG